MSKFKRTAETESEISSGPLIFSQLGNLVSFLINEAVDLQEDFKTKAEFVNEQFLKACQNEQKIENIFKILLELQQQLSFVEMELQQVECFFNQLKNIVEHLEIAGNTETFSVRSNCGCGSCHLCCCKTERQSFMKLLEETNQNVEVLPSLKEDAEALRSYVKLRNPYSEILEILYCHCEILKKTEENMRILLDKLVLIEFQQLSLKKQVRQRTKK